MELYLFYYSILFVVNLYAHPKSSVLSVLASDCSILCSIKTTMILKIIYPAFIATVILFGGQFADCGSLADVKEQVSIVFTGEENGYLKPCGCTGGQLGGIARRYELIESLKTNGHIVLPVSLGDLAKYSGRQSEIKIETMLKTMDMMGYVVHNIGENDLVMDSGLLYYLFQMYNVEFITANVKFINNSEIDIKPYLIKKIVTKEFEFRVGFLGILSPLVVENELLNIEITDPVDALIPIVEKIREDVDIIILLAHVELDDAEYIANKFPEIDVIIIAHGEEDPETSLKMVNDTLITSSIKYGKYAGIVKFCREREKWQILPGKDGKLVEMVPVDERFNNRPSKVDALIAEYKSVVMQEDLLGQHQRVELAKGEQYEGNTSCGACHPVIFKHWKNTKHFVAYETLENGGDQHDPECVKCHVVGLDYTTGFQDVRKTPELKGVGCESCHGFGSMHIEDTSIPYDKIYKMECLKCHDPENSPRFDFLSYWEKIKHPVE